MSDAEYEALIAGEITITREMSREEVRKRWPNTPIPAGSGVKRWLLIAFIIAPVLVIGALAGWLSTIGTLGIYP